MTRIDHASREYVRAAFARACRGAVVTAYRGNRVQCSAEQFPTVRRYLVRAVQVLVDGGDEDAAERVMVEVLRLDGVHGLPESAA